MERFASNPARFWSLETPSRVKMNAKSGRPWLRFQRDAPVCLFQTWHRPLSS